MPGWCSLPPIRRLLSEPAAGAVVVLVLAQELHREIAADSRVAALVNDPIPPAAQLAQQRVPADLGRAARRRILALFRVGGPMRGPPGRSSRIAGRRGPRRPADGRLVAGEAGEVMSQARDHGPGAGRAP